MDINICKECTRRCARFMCCMCERKDDCQCAKIEPPKDYDTLYEELVEVAHKIDPYYDIDKIKPYSVYIWTKSNGWGGDNVFDIEADKIVFYVEDYNIIEEAKPIIEKIQAKLKELAIYLI